MVASSKKVVEILNNQKRHRRCVLPMPFCLKNARNMRVFLVFSPPKKFFEEICKKGLTFAVGDGKLCVTRQRAYARAGEARTVSGVLLVTTIK